MRFHFVRQCYLSGTDFPRSLLANLTLVPPDKRDAHAVFRGTVASGHGRCSELSIQLFCPRLHRVSSGIVESADLSASATSSSIDTQSVPRFPGAEENWSASHAPNGVTLLIWILKIHDKNALDGFLLQFGRKLMGQRGECLHAGWPRFLLQRRRRKWQQRSNHDRVNHNCEAEWME